MGISVFEIGSMGRKDSRGGIYALNRYNRLNLMNLRSSEALRAYGTFAEPLRNHKLLIWKNRKHVRVNFL